MKSYFYIFTLCTILLVKNIDCGAPAQEECRRIHHCDTDPDGTEYDNFGCLLRCNIHGTIYEHNVNEGMPCYDNRHHCHEGMCFQETPELGYIDIEVISAQLGESANAYVTVCLLNCSDPVPLPLHNRTNCISCSTSVRYNTKYPQWNEICQGSGKYLFHSGARIVNEVWDHQGTGHNYFLGGSTFTIDQLLNHGDNHRPITLNLVNGKYPGKYCTRVTWTPKR